MLTSIGRAAARRVVAGANVSRSFNKTTNITASLLNTIRPAFVLRPISGRGFSVSRWPLLASKASGTAKKSTSTKKKPTTKTATKKKAATKTKKAAAPKKKKKAKKVLTPEEKKRERISILRRESLLREEPKQLPVSAWSINVAETIPAQRRQGVPMADAIRQTKAEYQNLPSSEMQRLQTQAEANRLTNQNKHQAWIQSLPVEDVYIANQARRSLKRIYGKAKRFSLLQDDRVPKRPANGFARYVQSHRASNPAQAAPQTMKDAGQDWKTMSEAEKGPYQRDYTQAMAEYKKEMAVLTEKARERKVSRKSASSSPAAST